RTAAVVSTDASDHLPVVADLALPGGPHRPASVPPTSIGATDPGAAPPADAGVLVEPPSAG
ncbi:MAG TPA: hypothetical protein VF743_08880, partial [Acidimicrobiales bacterium]